MSVGNIRTYMYSSTTKQTDSPLSMKGHIINYETLEQECMTETWLMVDTPLCELRPDG